MSILDEVTAKIEASKEVITTLPVNNAKNINLYEAKLDELKTEFAEYEVQALKEMERRVEVASRVKENNEFGPIKRELNTIEKVLYLLNTVQTAYEKLGFDTATHNLRYFYKKNLEVVNEAIVYCVLKFIEAGVDLDIKDFCYSRYIRDYLSGFLDNIKEGKVDFKNMQAKFEEIYWECSNLIIYIELNIRYLYFKNQKTIDKYYAKKQSDLLVKLTAEEILRKICRVTKTINRKN